MIQKQLSIETQTADDVLGFSFSPNVADAVNAGLLSGLESVQYASPGVVAASAAIAMGAAWLDRRHTGGIVNKLAWRSFTEPLHKLDNRSIIRKAAGAVALTVSAALPVGGVAFTFGLENAVRTGQLGVIDEISDRVGLDSDDLLITQGGVNTPMDTSFVPAEIAQEFNGAGMHVLLPNFKEQNGERMDGLLFSVPSLPEDTVYATGLTGIKPGQTVQINGTNQEIDKTLDRKTAAMRREVMIVSDDTAEEIMHTSDEDANYFGVLIPKTEGSHDIIQKRLDAEYGEGAYTVLTMEDFKEGTEEFMSNNGTAVLLLASVIAAMAGTVAETAAVRQKILNKKKVIATSKAIGGSNYTAAAPEIQAVYYKLMASLPLAGITAKTLEAGANATNLGLGMQVGPKELLAALVVVGAPSVGFGARSARNIVRKTTPVEAMREVT